MVFYSVCVVLLLASQKNFIAFCFISSIDIRILRSQRSLTRPPKCNYEGDPNYQIII